MKKRKHQGTIADRATHPRSLILRVIGERPDYRPYLCIHEVGDGPVLATVENTNALRGLAHAILRALEEEHEQD